MSQKKFVILNSKYFKSVYIEMKTWLKILEGNTSKVHVIELDNDTLKVKMTKIENNDTKRIKFKIEIYISQN